MEFHGIPWNLMEPHGISQNLTKPHGTSWNLMESHRNLMKGSRIWQNLQVADKRSPMMTSPNVSRRSQEPAVCQ
jgi:hypothetical protein